MANQVWDCAGFTDMKGHIGKPIPSGHVLVPGKIALDGDYLVWQFAPSVDEPPNTYRPSAELLDRFLRLHRSTADGVLKFAQKHGVLLLDGFEEPRFEWEREGREPIRVWQKFSRKACALLNVKAALGEGKLGDPADWHVIDPLVNSAFPKPVAGQFAGYIGHGIAAARWKLQWTLEGWLHFGRIGFGVDFQPGRGLRINIDYHSGRLFGALALQLLLAVTNADSLYFCSGCGLPYARSREKRRPREGQRNFCDECVSFKVPLQFADKDRKQKQAHARELYVSGTAISEIAKQLDSKPASIRRWLKGVKPNGAKKTT
ncbi:MAG: hypothetical protein M1541_11050 [Acidobacteria bacterium]|nr:hypothetical protein [Acidobacteriota bacterium]